MKEPQAHCPYCGRWLTTVHADGTFDLAPKASMGILVQVARDQSWAIGTPEIDKATCQRLRCRLRRRLRSAKIVP